MKVNWTLALAGLGLAFTPLAARAAADDVDFSKAMACGSLHIFLATEYQGGPTQDMLFDKASRWMFIAMARDGRLETVNEAELEDEIMEWVANLVYELEEQKEGQLREALLSEKVNVCERLYQSNAEEFDSITP